MLWRSEVRKSWVRVVAAGSLLAMLINGSPLWAEETGSLFQYSTLNALAQGGYDGELTCQSLLQHGNFGVGTYNRLDGEMIVLGGHCYQMRSDGVLQTVALDTRTPFAVITFFTPEKTIPLDMELDWPGIQAAVKQALKSVNLPCAFKLTGDFTYVKTRSVPAQIPPYVKLAEVVKTQPTFEYQNQSGTLIGFWFPEYMQGINLAGFHCHFLATDLLGGGHLLECRAKKLILQIQSLPRVELQLQDKGAFLAQKLTPFNAVEMDKIERVAPGGGQGAGGK